MKLKIYKLDDKYVEEILSRYTLEQQEVICAFNDEIGKKIQSLSQS